MIAANLQRGDVVEAFFEDRGVLRVVMPTMRTRDGWMCRTVDRITCKRLTDPDGYRASSHPLHFVADDLEVRVLRYQRDVQYRRPADVADGTHDPQLESVADLPDLEDGAQPELFG